MAAFLRAVVAASVLAVSAASLQTAAQQPTGEETAARKERRERYARLAEVGDQGDFGAACSGFAQLDVEEPNETFLVAALKACLLARDLERTAELARRATRSPPGPDLESALREATNVLGREGTTTDVEPPAPAPPPPPPPPPPPARAASPAPEVDASVSDSSLSPAFFFVGLGLTAVLAVSTLASALDTKDRHDEYVAKGVGADDGEAAQLRTNALFFTTLGVGVATGAIGIFATRWSDSGSPDGAVARLTLAH